MGSYVKKSTVRTDANGLFSLSAEVPKDQRFELRTSNLGRGTLEDTHRSFLSDACPASIFGLLDAPSGYSGCGGQF
jgi:hypothetical protein